MWKKMVFARLLALVSGPSTRAAAMETETPVRKTEEGEGTIEGAGEEVEGRRATRGAPEDGKQQLQKVRAPKRPRDTDASLAALNLQQPFNVPQYRFTPVIPFESVTLSHFDRAPQLRIAKDALTVSGHKGYRELALRRASGLLCGDARGTLTSLCTAGLIRGTHGVSQGAWYCEATVMEDFQDNDLEERFLNAKGHCRLGWARSAAHIQMPVGSDRFGYSMCLCTGHIVHERRPREYSSPSEDAGTVIGFYIYLPERNHPEPAPVAQEKRDQFWWKNSGKEVSSYFGEDKDACDSHIV